MRTSASNTASIARIPFNVASSVLSATVANASNMSSVCCIANLMECKSRRRFASYSPSIASNCSGAFSDQTTRQLLPSDSGHDTEKSLLAMIRSITFSPTLITHLNDEQGNHGAAITFFMMASFHGRGPVIASIRLTQTPID